MSLLAPALALVALPAAQTAQAHGVAGKPAPRDALIHGMARDERSAFVTEPGGGRELATPPAPPNGFKLPFTLRPVPAAVQRG